MYLKKIAIHLLYHKEAIKRSDQDRSEISCKISERVNQMKFWRIFYESFEKCVNDFFLHSFGKFINDTAHENVHVCSALGHVPIKPQSVMGLQNHRSTTYGIYTLT